MTWSGLENKLLKKEGKEYLERQAKTTGETADVGESRFNFRSLQTKSSHLASSIY